MLRQVIKRPLRKALFGGLFFFLVSCGGSTSDVGSGDIALIESQREVAGSDLLTEVAKEFYKSHLDQYDMLVLWGAPEFAPGHSFYWPVKNDVPGIGYENGGPEFFDNSADFGSRNLQGIIWMGPDWIANTDNSLGPRSVLGILAQETGHRWAATLHFIDPDLNTGSSALLEDPYHWSFYLNTEASPMGGNQWESQGGSLYQALPVDHVKYCQLDLYTMGLLPAEEVDPLELLVNVHNQNGLSDTEHSKTSSRTSQPVTVEADIMEVSIEQIIEAEGERDPDVGFNATTIRQAWIYVYRSPHQSAYLELENLEELQNQWSDYFNNATDGRSMMDTVLH